MKKETKKAIIKISATALIVVAIFLIIFLVLKLTGLDKFFTNLEKIKAFILKHKSAGIAIYMSLTVLQVVVLPIPSAPLNIVGVALYGPLLAYVLTLISVVVGSMIAFYVGKVLGKKFLVWLAGEKLAKKYIKLMRGSGKFYLALMLLLPFFPDDTLCIAAGAGLMPAWQFLIIILITRPPMIAFTSWFGMGDIIPFKGWGIPVWIAIFVFFALIIFIVHKAIDNKNTKKKKTGPNKT